MRPDPHSFNISSERLVFAWLILLAFSFASAVLTMLPVPSAVGGGGIMFLALVKSRVILSRYLGLAQSPAWLRGFTIVLTGFSVLVFGLYLI
ncbi:nitric oxide reductase F protein [Rhodobacteraceae bacterium B1Z28]|uniref:Nitric oxide reductase F protein n=1 Tax=Ruegeria haliotis TaxID=2747601 RepID=A0ABX2PKX0_9RHOB|nr:nitric oxide reductase F protein [Ruegeria haliotis]NVO54746.1 nitric oxide reductase F protein [Ruegeria haliotis]